MIKVTRTSGAPVGIPKLAQAEEKRNAKKSKRTFRVYSHKLIKTALEEMFHGKCAYCESKYQAVQPMDVEHWRPKSVYWFLAAEWTNLYPSCIDCNRQREHKVSLPDGTEKTVVQGKMDRFPLMNNAAVAVDRAGIDLEEPELLNPCNDEPEDYFEYTKEGVIRAKSGANRAETSIEVYALNRMGLVNERFEWQLIIGKHVHRIRQLSKVLEALNARQIPSAYDRELTAIIEDLVRYEVKALASLCDAAQPYAAQSRQLVKEFFDSADGVPEWLALR